MLAGMEGLGKSTFINTLLESDSITKPTPFLPPSEAHLERKPAIEVIPVGEREFFGNKLSLTFLDVQNYGESMVNKESFSVLLDYVEARYKEFLEEESRVKRNPRFEDNRVDVCLYFLPPTGKGLGALDRLAMQVLGQRVNIIPVLAKADAYSAAELSLAKSLIMHDIREAGIQIFDFAIDVENSPVQVMDEEVEEGEMLQKMIPFSVLGADPEQRPRIGRGYKWGFAEANDEKISNLGKLKSVLFSSHLLAIKEKTQAVLYETFRTEVLSRSVNA